MIAQDISDWGAGFRAQIGQCWNLSAIFDDITPVIVTVGFELDAQARPITDSITLLGHNGTQASEADAYFAAARRAIVRCGSAGYGLPPELYDQWRHVELTFDPNQMARR
ncbi:MAG: hypothetical protein ACSHW1_17675 [Yoonia sp.]|uniref:hypothetical protein n=1 Tax=Yoonia sp. TaxID=2212373 RepID=UPI003EF42AE5